MCHLMGCDVENSPDADADTDVERPVDDNDRLCASSRTPCRCGCRRCSLSPSSMVPISSRARTAVAQHRMHLAAAVRTVDGPEGRVVRVPPAPPSSG